MDYHLLGSIGTNNDEKNMGIKLEKQRKKRGEKSKVNKAEKNEFEDYML
jgi:hypothetical protein